MKRLAPVNSHPHGAREVPIRGSSAGGSTVVTERGGTDEAETGTGRWLPLLLVAVAALVGAFTLRDHLTLEALRDNRDALTAFRDANYAGTVAAYMAAYIAIVALSLPGATVTTLAGGFLFGIFPGVLIVVAAATIGATMLFLAARWGAGERLAARMDASEGVVRRIKAGMDANLWSMLFLIRLVPAVPFFVANLVPALVGVRLLPFAVTTFLGIIPGSLVYTSVGAGLGEVFARDGTPDLGLIFEPHVLLPILGLCALAALPIVIKAMRGGRAV